MYFVCKPVWPLLTGRMLAAERRRVGDLQAAYAAQARRLHEVHFAQLFR